MPKIEWPPEKLAWSTLTGKHAKAAKSMRVLNDVIERTLRGETRLSLDDLRRQARLATVRESIFAAEIQRRFPRPTGAPE